MELGQRRLGDFELRERLGEGGMGVVFRAVQLTLGREAVIKVLRAPHRASASMGERFVREAQLASRLEHPYAAHVYAFGAEADGLLWIAMERVRGTSLSDFLVMHGPWSLDRLVPFFERICETVQTAHEQGIVHRDIKPSNIMVMARAGQLLPKLLDFGIAKWMAPRETTGETMAAPSLDGANGMGELETLVSDTGSSGNGAGSTIPDITRPGAVLGSPMYMAPEQWNDPAGAAEPADQYALGVLLYETLTGDVPFRASSVPEMCRLHCEAEPPAMAGVPAGVERVVRRALAKRPEQRFASVLELAAALRVAASLRRAATLPPPDAGSFAATDANPYRGLLAFEAEHQHMFFGRDADTREVIARLRRDPLLLVAGDSGVGKSSLCRAGVLPRIEQGALGDDRGWQVVTVQPGRRPAFALAAALAPLAGGGGGESLDTVVARVAQRVRRGGDADAPGLVLFVDQLEEVVTLAGDDEAERFVAALLALSALPGGVRVLAAVRGDFATRVLARLGPGEEVARTLFVLRPLDEAGVRAAITQPALAAGHRFESDAMVDALVEQASRLDGALPLLQFALAELWELRDPARGLLPASALEQVGGIAGIVARHADGVLARLRPSVRAAARPLLLRLVTAERTRARRREEELLPEDAPADARAALEALIQARIVVARDGEEGAAYELTHEVLIRSWGTLGGWLDSDAERHAAEARVRAAAAEWERLGRPREELLGAAQLQEAAVLDGVPLDAGAAAFLRASRGALRRRRLAWRGGLAAAFLLLASVAVALTYFNREATHQNDQARRHIVKLYTEQGRRALLDGHRQRALVYLAEAWRRGGRDPALRFLLRRAATALDQQQEVLRGHQDFVRDARFSPDGRTIATISDDRTARLWDTATGRERVVLRGHTDWVRAVAFSPDGRSLLTVSWDGTARLWDAASGRSRWVTDLREGAAPPDDLHSAAGTLSLPCAADFSPDGSRIVAGCVDDRVALLARGDGAITARVAWEGGSVISAAFSPDGRRLVVTAFDGSVRLVEAVTGAVVASLVGHEGSVRSGAFSPDGTLLLTTGRDGAPRLWSADDGHTVAVLRGHQGPAGARFTPDGARILTTGVDRTVRVWDARDGHVVGVSQHHDGPVSAGDVSPDGRMFFTGDEAGIGVLSDIAGRRLAVFEGHTGLIWSARFAPDGSRVVTASQDGTARIWRVGGDAVVSLRDHEAAVTAVRFSPTERRLFTASEDATIRDWRLSDDAAPTSTVFARDADGFLALAVTGDGRFVAAGGQGGAVRIWETATAREVRALRVGAAGTLVNAVAFDAAGAVLATTSSDGMVRLWDVASGRRLAELRAHGGQDVFPVAFDSTGTRFATGGNDGAARVWDARDRRELRSLDHGDPIGYVAFCGDRLVVTSGATVRTWRLDGTQDATFAALGEAILAPTCPGDRITVAGGRAVGVWDLHGGSQLENIGIGGADIFTVDVASNGGIAVGTLDGTVTLVRLELDTRSPEEQVELARALPFELSDGGVIRLTR